MSFNLRIFLCPIVTYCIIFTSFIVDHQDSTYATTTDEPQNTPVLLDLDDCVVEANPTVIWLLEANFGINSNEVNCFEELPDIRTYECLDKCLLDDQCKAIVRKKVDDGKSSGCFMKTCDSPTAIINDEEYSTYVTKTCNLELEKYRYLPDLFLTPFIFNPSEQCQQPKINVDINACDYLTWHVQENIDMSVSAYDTKKNIPAYLCINDCIQDANCKAVIVEDVAPFGWTCHFYKQIEGKSNTKVNKFLYEKICCPMQPIDKAKDKLILYSPYGFFCQNHKENYNKDCVIKFWIVRNNRRIEGTYTIHSLASIQDCLLKCLNDTNCIAANIDLYKNRCLIATSVTNYAPSHTKNTVYKLACCTETDTLELIAAARNDLLKKETIITNISLSIHAIIVIVIGLLLFISTCVYILLNVYWFHWFNI